MHNSYLGKRMGLHTFMVVPAAALFTLFFIIPFTQGVGMSLTDWNGVSAPKFIGIKNFIDFFYDPRAVGTIRTTLLFASGSAPLLNIVGLCYALLMNSVFRGKSLARLIIYLPVVISPLIMGYIWYFLLQPSRGFIFHAFEQLIGNGSWVNGWMSDYRYTIMVLILVNVWQYAGMTMVIYLAGLQTISTDLYESAYIDGAGKWIAFWKITLPLLRPAIQINVVTNIIGSLAVFDKVISLTDGGPGYATETLSIYIMRMCFGNRTGYSTAVAMIMFFITLIPVIISMKLTSAKKEG